MRALSEVDLYRYVHIIHASRLTSKYVCTEYIDCILSAQKGGTKYHIGVS